MKITALTRYFTALARYFKPLARGWDKVRPKLPHYVALTRIDRPVGIFLLLWPTWWALVIAAGGMPDLWVVMVFTAGVILTRLTRDGRRQAWIFSRCLRWFRGSAAAASQGAFF